MLILLNDDQLQMIQQQRVCLPRLLCGSLYIDTDDLSCDPVTSPSSTTSANRRSSRNRRSRTATAAIIVDKDSSASAAVTSASDSSPNCSLPKKIVSSGREKRRSKEDKVKERKSKKRLIVSEEAAVSITPHITINSCVQDPVAGTAGSSESVGEVSSVSDSLNFHGILPCAVNLSNISSASSKPVSPQDYRLNCCSAVSKSLSADKTSSTLSNSKVSTRRYNKVCVNKNLLQGTTCYSPSSSEPVVTSAPFAVVTRSTALRNRLSVPSDSRCSDNVSSHHSVADGSSVTQAPDVTVETSEACSAGNVISLGFHPSASANVISSVSECGSSIASCRNQLSVGHVQLPSKNLNRQSVLTSSKSSFVGPLLSALRLPCSTSCNAAIPANTVPSNKLAQTLSEAHVHAEPTSGIVNQAHLCTTTSATTISNPVSMCTVPAVRIGDQFPRCRVPGEAFSDQASVFTVPSSGISRQVRTCTVPTASVISDRVRVHARPATGISSSLPELNISSPARSSTVPVGGISSPDCVCDVSPSACTCSVPAVSISAPVSLCKTPICRTNSQVDSCSVPPSMVSDTVLPATIPVSGISSHVDSSPVPGISDSVCLHVTISSSSSPVCQYSMPTTLTNTNSSVSGNITWNKNPTLSLTVPVEVRSSASVRKIRHVLSLAAGCSTRHTPMLTPATVPNSVYTPVSSCVEATVKPAESLMSTPRLTCSSASATSVYTSSRHFLDTFTSINPRPCVTSVTRSHHHSSSLHSLATTNVHRKSCNSDPVTRKCRMKQSSLSTPVLTSVLGPPACGNDTASGVRSFSRLSLSHRIAARPTFVLCAPEHRQLLEKIALRLLPQSAKQQSTNVNTVDSLTNGSWYKTFSSSVGATDSVAMVASSRVESRCRGNSNSRNHLQRVRSIFPSDKVPESVAMVTSSHLSSTGNCYCGIRKLSGLTSSIADSKDTKSVVMATASPCRCGDPKNRHHGNRNVFNQAVTTTADRSVNPVTMVTTSLADYHNHSNREMSGVNEAKRSHDTVLDSRCHSNREVYRTAARVPLPSVAMVTASSVAPHHYSNKEVAGNADTMMAGTSVQRKADRLKLCTEVTSAIVHNYIHCSALVMSAVL